MLTSLSLREVQFLWGKGFIPLAQPKISGLVTSASRHNACDMIVGKISLEKNGEGEGKKSMMIIRGRVRRPIASMS